jgi:predicted DNA-binding transcriptional regulator AlpA
VTGREKEQLRRLLAKTVGTDEIGEWAGVHRTVVSNWLVRNGDFPQPVAYVGRTALFDPVEVKAWLRSEARIDRVRRYAHKAVRNA